ncbi:orotate phosphoribosyltransferase [Candidatus Margulisiibacteriota bacterium]
MTKKELAKLVKEASFLTGDFTLSSGKKSKYYFDKYLFETRPEILAPLTKEMAAMLPPLDSFNRIAGPELGAIALATALSLEIKKPFIIVRKGEKGYGTGKIVEGEVSKGEKLVLVEDIMTSGKQAIAAADKLKHSGIEVILILGVIDREEGAREAALAAGYKFKSVFTKTELGI